jgi:hypothetical protein
MAPRIVRFGVRSRKLSNYGRPTRIFLDHIEEVLEKAQGQEYPNPAGVYEEFGDSGRSERDV